MSASAATPSCGFTCSSFSITTSARTPPQLRPGYIPPGQKVGHPQILFRVSNSDPAEDYTVSYQGQVSDFFAAGMVSSAVNLHYGAGTVGFPDDFAYEIQYSPYGVDSGLCACVEPGGPVPRSPWSPAGSTPTPCGSSTSGLDLPGYVPLIDGRNTNLSQP